MKTIEWNDFEKIELLAYKLKKDLGPEHNRAHSNIRELFQVLFLIISNV